MITTLCCFDIVESTPHLHSTHSSIRSPIIMKTIHRSMIVQLQEGLTRNLEVEIHLLIDILVV